MLGVSFQDEHCKAAVPSSICGADSVLGSVLPIRATDHPGETGTKHYENDVRSCYSDPYPSGSSKIKDCVAEAEGEYQKGLYAGFGIEYDKGHSWSYGWYFRVWWQLLLMEGIIPPVLIYGFIWIVATVSAWIWRPQHRAK